MQAMARREQVPDATNPLGLAGIEFVEYATARPQALGQVLERMGFVAVARHRSREVLLYRQGSMNVVVNAHADDARVGALIDGQPVISAVALRVGDAAQALSRCVALGAWEVPSHAQAMELHIPAIHGPGRTRLYFVDRWQDFSIYDVDFVPLSGGMSMPQPPALAGMAYFGIVQYVGAGRTASWLSHHQRLFGFQPIADDQRFGILPKGKVLASPCGGFLWQLVEPEPWMDGDDTPECLQRVALGVPDVAQAVALLKQRGVHFVEAHHLHPDDRGALTRSDATSVAFELVHQAR
jgi:4-hydroxyphenylpyruvate dioxygenase